MSEEEGTTARMVEVPERAKPAPKPDETYRMEIACVERGPEPNGRPEPARRVRTVQFDEPSVRTPGEHVGTAGMVQISRAVPAPVPRAPETFRIGTLNVLGDAPVDTRPVREIRIGEPSRGETVRAPVMRITSDDSKFTEEVAQVDSTPAVQPKGPTVSVPVVEVDHAEEPRSDGIVHSPLRGRGNRARIVQVEKTELPES